MRFEVCRLRSKQHALFGAPPVPSSASDALHFPLLALGPRPPRR